MRQAASDTAPVVFEAQQSVILEVEDAAGGWLKVKHRDGPTGYIKTSDVWGA